jgi:hypothetical protein
MKKLGDRRATQVQAAEALGLTVRAGPASARGVRGPWSRWPGVGPSRQAQQPGHAGRHPRPAMDDLNIDVICANSPAAKGRVERANQTLQDRLVKELRLRGINDRAAGNAYLNEFREDYNRRFACIPRKERNAHRALLAHEDLARVFSWQEERRLTNNLTLHYKRVLYAVESTPASEKARRKLVGVREDEDGSVHIEYRGAVLKARAFSKDSRVRQGAVVENKLLGYTLQVIGMAQRKRDEDKLAAGKMTLRDEDLLRKAMGQPRGLPTRRAEARQARAASVETTTASAMSASRPLAEVLAWAKQQIRD